MKMKENERKHYYSIIIINRMKLYGEKFSNKKILISVIENFDLIVIVSGGVT